MKSDAHRHRASQCVTSLQSTRSPERESTEMARGENERDDGVAAMCNGRHLIAAEAPPTRTMSTAGRPGPVVAGDLPAIGSAIGHYELIREIGRGGMGAVFLARDNKLGRLVAIKFLTRYSGDRAVRFLAEARATARCKHENIVIIHDVDEYGGYPYTVLEYIKGPTLREWMAQRASSGKGPVAWSELDSAMAATVPVSPGLAVELMVPVVRALICAHESGIVHRDLKPDNILLDDSGPIKVLDFGIAKQLSSEEISALASDPERSSESVGITRRGALVGTLPYMSPEQWGADQVDSGSDLWAVGIMLYELVTGQHPLAPLRKKCLEQVADLDVPMPRVSEIRPDIGPLDSIIDRCLRKSKAERIATARALLAELEPLLPTRQGVALADHQSPFPGLAAFQESDAVRFYGRDREISSLMSRLRNHSLVTVAGPSGAGKSSLIRAGIIPALKRSGYRWQTFVLRPGRRPLAALADALIQLSTSSHRISSSPGHDTASRRWPASPDQPDSAQASRALLDTLHGQPGYLGAQLRAGSRREGHRVLLFVDQFEELYTLGVEPDERAAFVACLEGVADDPSSPLRVVLALRADYLERLADEHQLMSEVTRGLCFLPPMGQDELRQTVTRPVEAAGYRFETTDMVDSMLDTLATTRSPLPLVQFTAAKLWEARDRERRILTRHSYDHLGGIAGALSTHADAVLAGLSPREQRLARAVLLRLVTPERTRAVVSMDELRDLAEDGHATSAIERPVCSVRTPPRLACRDVRTIDQVIRHLASARIVVIESSPERDNSTVELIHESLIERWPRLARWLDEDEEDAHFVARLRGAAEQWESSGFVEGLLWRGRAAEDARHWLDRWRAAQGADSRASFRDALSGRDKRYLLAVVALAERSRRQRWRVSVAAFVSLVAIALGLSYLAVLTNREAKRADQEAARVRIQKAEIEREAARARNATRLASARERQSDPTTVLALVREIEPAQQPRGWSALARWALHRGVARVVLTHPDVVRSAAFSPGGERIVTTSYDHVVRVWNADGSGEPVVLRGHQGRVFSAVFSSDGKRIVTASIDHTARVWNADGSGQPIVLRGHERWVKSAVFSPDGNRILTASWDHTARLWNADGSGEPVVLRGHEGGLNGVAFSPGGERIATASYDKTVRIWNADGSATRLVLRGHQGSIYSVAFSPDGKRIATASYDNTARIWNADGSGQPIVFRGHELAVYSVSFSSDGGRILTASWDKTARVWNADGSGDPMVIRGHEHYIFSAAFSADDARIVTASEDGTARVWDADGSGHPVVLRGHADRVASAAFSPTGDRIVTASWDNIARVWNADGSGRPVLLRGHEKVVYSASFSRDGQRIVTASWDHTARVWKADGSGQPVVLRQEDRVFSAAFSPDGNRIVTASADRTARIWNADGSGRPIVLRGHDDRVLAAVFSPDGKRVATTSWDETVRLWNADGSGQIFILHGHDDSIHSVAFSPDGNYLATAGYDKMVRVWKADGSGLLRVFRGHQSRIYSVAFSPGGTRIISGSEDKTARIWDTHGSAQPQIFRGHSESVFSASFSPDGTRVVTASGDKTAWVWDNIERLSGPDDAKLWTATRYCMPIERRRFLLNVTMEMARANRAACLRRVDRAQSAVSLQWPRNRTR
ncbi:MAG: protein kinase [Proteobacteria bacterium]|nr:protein kinase [Pseudomonadota bacterium]